MQLSQEEPIFKVYSMITVSSKTFPVIIKPNTLKLNNNKNNNSSNNNNSNNNIEIISDQSIILIIE